MIKELLDLKPRNPYLSIALDEALVRFYEKKDDFRGAIRLWSNPFSIVMGRTCIPDENLKPSFIAEFNPSMMKTKWRLSPALCRRASGGGTVIHGPGNINYSLCISLKAFPELFDLKKSYQVLLGMVSRAIEAQGVECGIRGLSDIVCFKDGVEKKISGNSQFRKSGILVHHGTLITRNNLIHSVSEYLIHPPKEPDYRQGRSHESFLGSLPDGFDLTTFYSVLSEELMRYLNQDYSEKMSSEEKREIFRYARKLVRDVYVCNDWVLKGKVSYGPEKNNSGEININISETGT